MLQSWSEIRYLLNSLIGQTVKLVDCGYVQRPFIYGRLSKTGKFLVNNQSYFPDARSFTRHDVLEIRGKTIFYVRRPA